MHAMLRGVGRRIPVTAVTLVSLAAGMALAELGGPLATERGERDGRGDKRGTGRSFLRRTVVDPAPSISEKAAGFDAERAWSGQDDGSRGGPDPMTSTSTR